MNNLIFVGLSTLFTAVSISWLISSPKKTNHKIYLASTTHSRLHPVTHTFKYPLFYFGIDLDTINSIPAVWPFFSFNGYSIFAFWEKDYLADSLRGGETGLKKRLLEYLESFNIPSSEIGRVEIIAMPRVLGMVFNPLTVYYCFANTDDSGSNEVRAIVMEVSNTFKERHIYICDKRNQSEKSRTGYLSSHNVSRRFHVSPFNHRAGTYEIHVGDLSKSLNILFIIKEYIEDLSSITTATIPEKHLIAKMTGKSYDLSTLRLIYLMIAYPITSLLVVPRIMYEAWILAYRKKLKIYQRPNPVRGVEVEGGTIIRKKISNFEKLSMKNMTEFFLPLCERHQTSITLHLPDSTTTEISPSKSTALSTIEIFLPSYKFFQSFLLDSHIGRTIAVSFIRGDIYCTQSDLEKLLKLLRKDSKDLAIPTSKYKLFDSTRNWYSKSHLTYFNDPLFTEFRPLNWKLSNSVLLVQEAIDVLFSRKLFELTTVFVVDPAKIEERIQSYIEELEKNPELINDGMELKKLETGKIEDECMNGEKERIRFVGFMKALKDLS
ncbi:hypothetical protein HK098_005002 [Nowakowskiella sp. JEL0407]|nr:hypothetical protein HK098_005002 [Nowakowskiella sp. JEL0407]